MAMKKIPDTLQTYEEQMNDYLSSPEWLNRRRQEPARFLDPWQGMEWSTEEYMFPVPVSRAKQEILDAIAQAAKTKSAVIVNPQQQKIDIDKRRIGSLLAWFTLGYGVFVLLAFYVANKFA